MEKTWNEAEIVRRHNQEESIAKATEQIVIENKLPQEHKEQKEQKEYDITVPSTPPDIMIGQLAHYFGIKEVDEKTKHEIEKIYQWASKNTKGITPDDTLDTLDLLGEKLGIMRFGEDKFKVLYNYVTLQNTAEDANREINSLETRWPKLRAMFKTQ